MKIKAALQKSKHGTLSICTVNLEEPRSDEVLVKIVACGVCHTDIMMQHDNSDYPFILVHEGSGIIEKIGTSIKEYSVGDHVIISYTSCGHCDACCEKRPYQCKYIYIILSFFDIEKTEQQVYHIKISTFLHLLVKDHLPSMQ